MTNNNFLQIVPHYLDIFQRGERYFEGDQKRMTYFRENPLNEDASEIVVKVSSVEHDLTDDVVYSRQLMADHIASLHIDQALQLGDPDIVDAIARLNVGGRSYFLYGFATRYCNLHNRKEYPIYDPAVRRLLTCFWREGRQYHLTDDEFFHYARFKELMLNFREEMGMNEYDFKELDSFVWVYGDKIAQSLNCEIQPTA